MSRWLGVTEPVVRVHVRLPRLKSKDERLRERATSYVESMLWLEGDVLRSRDRKRAWVQIRLNERKAVLARVNSIPRYRVFLRRELLRQLCDRMEVPKWW